MAYGGSVKTLQNIRANHLGGAKGVSSVFLAILASLVVLSERGIAGLLWEHRRVYNGRRRGVSGFARVDASSTLA